MGRLFYALLRVVRERFAAAWADPEFRRMIVRWAVSVCRRRAAQLGTGAALAYVGNEMMMITHEGDLDEMD